MHTEEEEAVGVGTQEQLTHLSTAWRGAGLLVIEPAWPLGDRGAAGNTRNELSDLFGMIEPHCFPRV